MFLYFKLGAVMTFHWSVISENGIVVREDKVSHTMLASTYRKDRFVPWGTSIADDALPFYHPQSFKITPEKEKPGKQFKYISFPIQFLFVNMTYICNTKFELFALYFIKLYIEITRFKPHT